MRITVLAGGIGGAKFLRGVRAAFPDDELTAIVNTGDDVTLHGLRVCPDLDSVMYTLGGANDEERGWGRADETWRIQDELRSYGAQPDWFNLGDLDIATLLVRTRMLDAGYPLSDVTAALCERWQPGVRLLPMTDDRCETYVVVDAADDGSAGGDPSKDGSTNHGGRRQAIHFQEWWVKERAALPAHRFVQVGVEDAEPAPGVLAAIDSADVVLLAPSNPVVSIGTVLGVPGIREAIVNGPARVAGLSPIVGGAPVRGMADACLPVIDVEVSALGVGRHYGARSAGGLLDAWLIDSADAAPGAPGSGRPAAVPGVDMVAVPGVAVQAVPGVAVQAVPGVAVQAVPLLMTDVAATVAMARAAVAAALTAGSRPSRGSAGSTGSSGSVGAPR